MEQLAPGDRRSALHLGTLVCFGFPGGQVCGLATKSRPSGGVCSHSIIDLQKEVEASCGALGLLGFRWGRNRRGGVCPGGDTSCFPAVLPRSSSRAGRTTCRSATSLGWAQPPTVATPPMARALRATRWRTTGSSSGEAPGALFRAPEAVLQLSHVGACRRGVAHGRWRLPLSLPHPDLRPAQGLPQWDGEHPQRSRPE